MMQENVIYCQKCGTPIGVVEIIEGQRILHIGNQTVMNYRGYCDNCQEPFNWYESEQQLLKLVRRVQEMMKNNSNFDLRL